MISIIIPTLNEAGQISKVLTRIFSEKETPFIKEVIVCDGGSIDSTVQIAKQFPAHVIECPEKGRAKQMNAGAKKAVGRILYFLHADTLPPVGFAKLITESVNGKSEMGCFKLRFDYNHWFLKANSWFTRFNIGSFRFGDQSLFVTKAIFDNSGGFNEDLIMLEDQEFIKRIQKNRRFIVLPKSVITSARKYLENGIFKTQAVYFLIYCMYRLGFGQQKLLKTYKKFIRQDKL